MRPPPWFLGPRGCEDASPGHGSLVAAAGSIVGSVRTDARLGLERLDAGVVARVRFTQRQRSPLFVVDETSGDIASARRIDRELLCPYVAVCEQVVEVTVTPLTLFQTTA